MGKIILMEKEKKYIKSLLMPFENGRMVDYITKKNVGTSFYLQFLSLGDVMNTFLFPEDDIFLNMELDKKYNFKEINLED